VIQYVLILKLSPTGHPQSLLPVGVTATGQAARAVPTPEEDPC